MSTKQKVVKKIKDNKKVKKPKKQVIKEAEVINSEEEEKEELEVEAEGDVDEDVDDVDNVDDEIIVSDYRELMKTYNPSNNTTSNVLTIYEATLILGKRITQLTYGSLPLIPYEMSETPEEIAIRELLMKKTPFIVKRQINNVIEYFKIEDMEINEEEITIF